MLKYQRGYQALPYLSSLFSTAGSAIAGAAGSATIGSTLAQTAIAVGAAKAFSPKAGKVPQAPGAPTLDLAANAQQQSDRLARRRGVLSNIYGGATTSSPAVVGRQTLGG